MEKLQIKAQVTKEENPEIPGLKGYASIYIGGMQIEGIKIMERGGYIFADLPQKKEDREGQTTYSDIVVFGNGKEDNEYSKRLKNAVLNTVIKAYEKDGRETSEERETNFNFEPDKVSTYVRPVTSEKIKGVSTLYYGNAIRINPVFLKELENKQTNERNLLINFPGYYDKNNEFKEYIHPIETGLRKKIQESCIEQYKKSFEKQENSNEEPIIENTDFYKEMEENSSSNTEEEEI